MLYKSADICRPILLPCKGTRILKFVTYCYSFYLRVRSVQIQIQSLYPLVRDVFAAKTFCTLADTFIPVGAMIYMQERSLHSLIRLLYLWCDIFTCKNVLYTRIRLLYPQVPSVTRYEPWEIPGCDFFVHKRVNYLPARINCYCDLNSHRRVKSIPYGNKFIYLFILEPIFITLIDDKNWEMITNNLTAVIEVALIDVALIKQGLAVFNSLAGILKVAILVPPIVHGNSKN